MNDDIYTSPIGGTGAFIVDNLSDDSVQKAKNLLAGIKHGAKNAIGSAIKRASTSGIAYTAKAVRKEYMISAADFKKYTKSKRHYETNTMGSSISIVYFGWHIPLAKFDTRVSKDGLVTTRVKRTSARTVLDNIFQQSVGKYGHTGLFERVDSERYPIAEKFGPSVPQMMSSNDELAKDIGDHVCEEFDKRLDHEITAILNGWRTIK